MTRFWVRTLEAVLLALFLAVALLAWRLNRGPLPLDSIAPYLENALSAEQPGVELKIGHASISWTSLLAPPILTVENVRAVDREGVVAAMPRMIVRLSVTALMRGTIAPETVVLTRPTLRVARHADGTFSLGFEPPTPDENAAPETPGDSSALATELISALTRPANGNNRASYLTSIAITDTRLVMIDEASGRRWLVPKASLNLDRAGQDVVLNATLPVIDDDKPWNIKVTGKYGAKFRTLALVLDMDGFRPSGISGLMPQLAPLSAVDLRVSGKVTMTLTLLDKAARMDGLTFDLNGGHGAVRIPAPVNRDYAVAQIVAKGSVAHTFDEITLEQLRVDLEGDEGATAISVTGQGKQLNSQPSVTADIAIGDMRLTALKGYWPDGIKDNAHRWISNNLNNGKLSNTRFHVELGGPSLKELAQTAFEGSSVLSGISVTYMKGLPPIDSTGAIMHLSPHEITMAVNDGHVVDAFSGKGLKVRGGSIRMFDLGSTSEKANVILDLTGDLGEVMRLINFQPLGYASAMGLDPTTVTGNAKVHLDFGFPLISDLKTEQLKIGVTATVDGAKIPNAALGQPLTDSHLSMTLDRTGMDVKGNVELAGIPAALVWRENFGGGAFRSRYEVDATLDNAARPKVGLGAFIFAPPYIDGPTRAHMIYVAKRDGTSTIDAEADLKDAAVDINQLGWRKTTGMPAKATVTAKLIKNRIDSIPAFHITGEDGADIVGKATFTGDSDLKTLILSKGDAGESHVTGELNLDDAGVYHFDVRGSAFNSTYFWKELGRDDARGGDKKKTPMEITATFDRMWMAKEGDFRDVHLSFRQSTASIEYVDFSSKVDGVAPFTLSLGSRDGKRVFNGASTNGGAVMRAIGLFGDIVGGNMEIKGELLADGSVKGRVDNTDFKLVQAPVIARLLSVASLGGILDQLRGVGISFKLLRVPFTYANSTIKIRNGEMYGALGLTGQGTYSFADSMMNFDGTIIPAYTINKIFRNIPLIGRILGGTEKGGGILAATYTYRGPVATAEPSVNPLAALTPGITRHLFDVFRGPGPKAAKPEDPPDTSEPDATASPSAPQAK